MNGITILVVTAGGCGYCDRLKAIFPNLAKDLRALGYRVEELPYINIRSALTKEPINVPNVEYHKKFFPFFMAGVPAIIVSENESFNSVNPECVRIPNQIFVSNGATIDVLDQWIKTNRNAFRPKSIPLPKPGTGIPPESLLKVDPNIIRKIETPKVVVPENPTCNHRVVRTRRRKG